MKTKKQNLISKLQIAIHALETDTVHYNWRSSASCNCGIVAQTMLGLTPQQLRQRLIDEGTHIIKIIAKELKANENDIQADWKTSVKAFCPITGTPIAQIYKDLNEAGLSKEDICHLEYMSNPLILKKAGINTKTKKLKEGLLNHLLNNYVEIDAHYLSKQNLIKYLKAWVEILKEQPEFNSLSEDIISTDELRSMEMTAVANQEFELAGEIRDRISSLKK